MRLEGRVLMGYYSTPLCVVERVKAFLKFPDSKINVLDPCCGEGEALKALVDGKNAETYGVELDVYRAEEAKKKINHVLKCGIEEARISNKVFSILWLNPPYDWENEEIDEKCERKEKTFLQCTQQYLKPKGLLVYIIPKHRLDKTIAKILAYRFEEFKVYRFPALEYEDFKQIVLMCQKKKITVHPEFAYFRS